MSDIKHFVPDEAVRDNVTPESDRPSLRVVRAEDIPVLVTEVISNLRKAALSMAPTAMGQEMYVAEETLNQIRSLLAAANGDLNPVTNTGLSFTGLTSDEFRKFARELRAAAEKEGVGFDLVER